jgi:F0F1-type ATP synthase epsilon subunit
MLNCTLISPLSQLEIPASVAVYVRASTGELGVLPSHAPMVCSLATDSVVRIVQPEGERRFRVGAHAFVKVEKDRVTLLAAGFTEEQEPPAH